MKSKVFFPNKPEIRLQRICHMMGLLLSVAGNLLGSQPVRADIISEKGDRFVVARNRTAAGSAMVNVIVRTNSAQAANQEVLLRALGGVVYNRLPLIDSVAICIPTMRLKYLARLGFVTRLSEDVVARKHDEFTVGASGADVAFHQDRVTGNGMAVAIIDSGINRHRDLARIEDNNRILANVNFVPNESRTDDPCGHGTHVAGIAVGSGTASSGDDYFRHFYGIARGANLVNVRVLDASGQGLVSSVISGIQWCVQYRAAYNIRVINLSLGHPVGESYTTDPLCQAVEQAWRAGIVVVCAAGNNGRLNSTQASGQTAGLDNEGWGTAYNTINSPANDPYVVTVGCMKTIDGVRANDAISTYSGRGPTAIDTILKPDIVAPGNRIISMRSMGSVLDTLFGSSNTVPINYYKFTGSTSDSSQYFRLSGTSMAAPVVAGAALLMLDADPTLTPDTIKARLMISADKWCFENGLYDPCTFGAGYLNIPAALRCTVVATQPALSPVLVRDAAGNVSVNQIIWGEQIIWGTPINDLSAVWGPQVIWNGNALSAGNISWGVQGSQIIWGDDGSTVTGGTGSLDMTSIYGED